MRISASYLLTFASSRKWRQPSPSTSWSRLLTISSESLMTQLMWVSLRDWVRPGTSTDHQKIKNLAFLYFEYVKAAFFSFFQRYCARIQQVLHIEWRSNLRYTQAKKERLFVWTKKYKFETFFQLLNMLLGSFCKSTVIYCWLIFFFTSLNLSGYYCSRVNKKALTKSWAAIYALCWKYLS